MMTYFKTVITAFVALVSGLACASAVPSNVSEVEVVPAARSATIQTEGVPLFVQSSIHPSGKALVFGLAHANNKDIVLLDNGLDQGLRNGMICEVYRGEHLIGDIILVEVRADRAVGLITALHGTDPIQFSDMARIKTIQF